jgi:hypothetical protein
MEGDREVKGQIVSNQDGGQQGKFEYHVVQIDLEETKESKAKRDGTNHVRFWIRNFKDSEMKKVQHCRFYPLVREFLKGGWPGANGSQFVGSLSHRTVRFYARPDEVWNTLVEKAADMEIETAKMNCNRVDTIAMDKKRVSDNRQQSARKKSRGK